jgi:hypothetical protein
MRTLTILAASVVLALPLAAQQQDTSAPPPQQNPPAANPAPPKKPDDTKKKSTAEANPFPEAQSQAAANQDQPQTDNSAPSAPAPQPAAPGDKSADQNPFPASQAKTAGGGQKPATAPGADASKSGDDYSSSQSGLKDLDLPSTKPNQPGDPGDFANATLAKKDTQVGMFYLHTGDYQGAYDRFVEAARADPGNADAVFGLAESAQRLNHRCEAVRTYLLYLTAVPDGSHAKDARKAVKDLGAQPGDCGPTEKSAAPSQ